MKKQFRAGIIPYYIEKDIIYMLFMKPSNEIYGGKDFQIAKGKVEEGESDIDAALREGFEELGLLQENIEVINDIGVHLGRTRFFMVRIKDKTNFTKFHFETEETKWLTFDNFKLEGRSLHFPIIKYAIDFINKNIE